MDCMGTDYVSVLVVALGVATVGGVAWWLWAERRDPNGDLGGGARVVLAVMIVAVFVVLAVLRWNRWS